MKRDAMVTGQLELALTGDSEPGMTELPARSCRYAGGREAHEVPALPSPREMSAVPTTPKLPYFRQETEQVGGVEDGRAFDLSSSNRF